VEEHFFLKTRANNTNSSSGFTLLELIIASSISSIVLVFILTLFSDTTKGIAFQNKRSKKVEMMILYKKRIETALDKFQEIKSISQISCEGIDDSNSTISIIFTNNTLAFKNSVLCTDIDKFKFEAENSCGNKTVLLWECTLKNSGWIGGGRIIEYHKEFGKK
jgi:prepilin-type N-terminal cleavage/methylation domain-containing protein